MATRDTIHLGRWSARHWAVAALQLVWLLSSIVGLLRWPDFSDHMWWEWTGVAACLLAMEAWLFAHRNDRLEFGTDALIFTRRGRETTLAWSDVETFWLDWTKDDGALRLVAGGRTYRIALDRLSPDAPAARRLREYLEPLWQRKLAAMAMGEVRPSKPFRERLGLAILALVVPVCLLMTWLPSSTTEDRLAGGGLALLLGILCVAWWRFDSAAPGPGTVRTWGRLLALERVETITIQRPRFGGERWQLRGRGVNGLIGPCVDFPLIVEHVLRSCPHAVVQYRIRKPRTDLEAVFLPVPAGGGEEFGSTIQAVEVENRQRLLQLTGAGLLVAVVMIGFAIAFAPMAKSLARDQAQWVHDAVTVQGQVIKGGPPWQVRYMVGDREFTPTLYHRAVPEPNLQAGQTVTLRYLPTQPGFPLLEGQTMPNPFPVGLVYVLWGLAALFGLIGLSAAARLIQASSGSAA